MMSGPQSPIARSSDERHALTLKRFQDFIRANPVRAWGLSVALLLVINLTAFCAMPGPKKPGLMFFFLCFATIMPTYHLLSRFSNARRRERPVSFEQESQVASLSLYAAFCSIGSFGIIILLKPLGSQLPEWAVLSLLTSFSLSEMLALALGCAVGHTKHGRLGLTVSAVWLLLVVAAGVIVLLKRLMVG